MTITANSAAADPAWVLINQFGGSNVFVDHASVESDGAIRRLVVKYELTPHGTDRRNGKAVREMAMHEEYDLSLSRFRVHRIVFTYIDGATAEPLTTEAAWKPATGGNQVTLDYLRAGATR